MRAQKQSHLKFKTYINKLTNNIDSESGTTI